MFSFVIAITAREQNLLVCCSTVDVHHSTHLPRLNGPPGLLWSQTLILNRIFTHKHLGFKSFNLIMIGLLYSYKFYFVSISLFTYLITSQGKCWCFYRRIQNIFSKIFRIIPFPLPPPSPRTGKLIYLRPARSIHKFYNSILTTSQN